ncbi:hypothetical protein FSPOR_4981 [Fusarium sporotrichioides]|uniref:Nucleotide-diphospho-sugar transferase domain-containing protein n=1 Tax=Fusarium sporotrichioides TaxID=5514 RepID=A0A395S996_FUSSP|nr:hypothetical protein FSPOR_4981 [Fusarium sporotrichioides]
MVHLFLRRGTRQMLLLAIGILVSLWLVVHSWPVFHLPPANDLYLPAKLAENTSQLMHDLWKPFLHNINATHFVTKEGYHYTIEESNYRWLSPLKKKLLILDVDTRLDKGAGALMNKSPLNPGELTGRSAGMMNHYLYGTLSLNCSFFSLTCSRILTHLPLAAMIHGYDYQFIRAPDYYNRHGTWVKVPMIKQALTMYETVVFLDADAVFVYPEIPFEWLMSLWNITDKTLVAMSNDPDSPRNRDGKGKVMMNTGFIIAQQSNRTQDLFHDWNQCPTETKYKGCQRWMKDWAHEQAAFSNHVRYDYSTDEVRTIPRLDGNGGDGVFVRHNWFHKDYPANDLRQLILDILSVRHKINDP